MPLYLPAIAALQALAGGAQKMYYTYVLKSESDQKYYVGWSNNLKQRIIEHNNGNVSSTASRRPLKLVYYEACLDKEKAIKREKYLKTGFGKSFLRNRI